MQTSGDLRRENAKLISVVVIREAGDQIPATAMHYRRMPPAYWIASLRSHDGDGRWPRNERRRAQCP